MGHLDAETIYELAEGRLDAARAGSAEAHLWRCDACRALREECVGTLDALRWYGQSAVPAPAKYWEGFWGRFPLAGELPAAARARRQPVRAWAAAAASVAILALGGWWAAGRLEAPAGTASPGVAVMAPDPVPASAAFDAAPGWEEDVEALRRMGSTIGSVDPLSKGFALASLAQEP